MIGVQLVRIHWSISRPKIKNRVVRNSSSTRRTKQPIKKKERPFSATLLTWVVLIMASLNWLQIIEVLRQWTFFQSISPTPPILYLAITGLVWGLIGAILVWGLFLGLPWAPGMMMIVAPVYAAAYWLDRLLIADLSAIITRWPFALGLTLLLLAYTFWVLSRPKVRRFYQKTGT